jgi:hypothetical protein
MLAATVVEQDDAADAGEAGVVGADETVGAAAVEAGEVVEVLAGVVVGDAVVEAVVQAGGAAVRTCTVVGAAAAATAGGRDADATVAAGKEESRDAANKWVFAALEAPVGSVEPAFVVCMGVSG